MEQHRLRMFEKRMSRYLSVRGMKDVEDEEKCTKRSLWFVLSPNILRHVASTG
jgi:hypothetical protein